MGIVKKDKVADERLESQYHTNKNSSNSGLKKTAHYALIPKHGGVFTILTLEVISSGRPPQQGLFYLPH